MDKTYTIFDHPKETSNEGFQETLVNPDGAGLEYHTFVSACEIPEEKVFWVISKVHEKKPFITGMAGSFKEAEKMVLEGLNNKRAICRSSKFALDEYIDQMMEKSANGQNGFAEAARLEFIFEKFGHSRFLIKRKTGDEIIVYAQPYSEKFKPSPDSPVFRLDKRQLDNSGESKARGRLYCTEERKWEIDRFRKIPSFLKIFNLDWDADISDVKYWFRKLSKEHHPDLGGSPAKFRELIESYEKAVKALKARDIRDGFIK